VFQKRRPKGKPKKRKGGIPLDKLLAAHSAGDARLANLVERYGSDVAPASKMLASSAES
jgi:hypothetical protein